jgi:type II secretory pathway component GspD/PulD (secretin)
MRGARLVLTWIVAAVLVSVAWGQEPPKPPAPAGQDTDPRAKAIRDQLEEQIRRERQQVTIKVRNARIAQIVEEFRRQTSWNLVVDYRNIPDDFLVDEFIVENEPARRALDLFAMKAELTVDEASPTSFFLSRPPRLTFNFRDADIKVVLDMIARVSGANIIIAPQVQGSITLSINNVPWQEVLQAVVKTLGFVTVKENFGIIRVIHQDELLRQMEVKVFPLRFIQPPSIYQAKVEEGKLVSGRPLQPPQTIEEILKQFVLTETLRTVLSRNAAGTVLGTLQFDPQTNSIVVRDTKVVLDKIAEIVALLDVELEQVLLDVKFISTTNEDLLTFGTSWNFGGEGGIGASTTMLRPSVFTTPQGTVTGKITKLPFGFGEEKGAPGDQLFLTQWDMTVTMRAFKQDRYSRLIQEPTLAVMDNTAATIFVGETISYAEVRTTTNQFGGLEFTVGEASKSPVKVGFQLFVVPKIVADQNKVILTVIPQNDFLSGQSGVAAVPGFERFTIQAGAAGSVQSIDLPRISTTTMVTKLTIESGRTAILGGLVVERSTFEDRGIPVLKDIPIVNYFFKQRNDTIRKEHLLIFVTPRIVRAGRGPSEALQKALELREKSERRDQEEMRKKEQEKK